MSTNHSLTMLAVLVALAAPAMAHAQDAPVEQGPSEIAEEQPAEDGGTVDMRGATARFDYDRGDQIFWGGVGSVAGLTTFFGLVVLSVATSPLICGETNIDCIAGINATSSFVGFMSVFVVPVVFVNYTGGERSNAWTQTGAIVGMFSGFFASGVVLNLLNDGFDLQNARTPAQQLLTWVGVSVVAILPGVTSALGYQLFYPGPEQLTVAPVFYPEGGAGVSMGFRF